MKLAVIWAVGYRVAGAKTSYEIRNTRNERNSASVTLLLASAANLILFAVVFVLRNISHSSNIHANIMHLDIGNNKSLDLLV